MTPFTEHLIAPQGTIDGPATVAFIARTDIDANGPAFELTINGKILKLREQILGGRLYVPQGATLRLTSGSVVVSGERATPGVKFVPAGP